MRVSTKSLGGFLRANASAIRTFFYLLGLQAKSGPNHSGQQPPQPLPRRNASYDPKHEIHEKFGFPRPLIASVALARGDTVRELREKYIAEVNALHAAGRANLRAGADGAPVFDGGEKHGQNRPRRCSTAPCEEEPADQREGEKKDQLGGARRPWPSSGRVPDEQIPGRREGEEKDQQWQLGGSDEHCETDQQTTPNHCEQHSNEIVGFFVGVA